MKFLENNPCTIYIVKRRHLNIYLLLEKIRERFFWLQLLKVYEMNVFGARNHQSLTSYFNSNPIFPNSVKPSNNRDSRGKEKWHGIEGGVATGHGIGGPGIFILQYTKTNGGKNGGPVLGGHSIRGAGIGRLYCLCLRARICLP